MNKRIITVIMSLYMGGLTAGSAGAQVLPVPEVVQEQTQWCWAACSEAVIRYFGGNVNQCDLADDLRIANQWGNDQCCMFNFRDPIFDTLGFHSCNQGNWLLATNESFNPFAIEDILNNNNITTQPESRALTANEISDDVNSGRPFIIGWRKPWPLQGGHVVVCRGFENQENAANPMIFYMDPWYIGGNNYYIEDLNWITSVTSADTSITNNHVWEETLRLSQGNMPLPLFADIKINGFGGTFTANSSQNLNITISLDPREYTDNADWWVLGQYAGVLYSCDLNGNWSEGVTPIYQGKLGTLSSYPIYSGTLGPGTYTFYFGADLDQDGIVNDPLYYDFITVIVQ